MQRFCHGYQVHRLRRQVLAQGFAGGVEVGDGGALHIENKPRVQGLMRSRSGGATCMLWAALASLVIGTTTVARLPGPACTRMHRPADADLVGVLQLVDAGVHPDDLPREGPPQEERQRRASHPCTPFHASIHSTHASIHSMQALAGRKVALAGAHVGRAVTYTCSAAEKGRSGRAP